MVRQLDEKALRALISNEAGMAAERFSFEWAGKQQSKRLAFTPSRAALTYDACRSLNSDGTENKAGETPQQNTSENLIIEGDNLEVLKLLQTTYFEQVKCIYIDPPYNTGNDFIYPDNFTEGKKAYWEKNGEVKEGVKLTALPETYGRRYSDWLNFMQSRLLLARQMLREDGVIFVSIDDNEVHNLRKLMDEVFGEENFFAELIWERAYAPKNDSKFISNSHDYVLVYSKSIELFKIGRLPRTQEADARYKNLDDDPRGVWKASDLSVKTYNAESDYPITTPSGRTIEPPAGRCWSLSKKSFFERLHGDLSITNCSYTCDDLSPKAPTAGKITNAKIIYNTNQLIRERVRYKSPYTSKP